MILITGASRGIGKYLFDKFFENSDKVYGTYFKTKPSTKIIDNFHYVQIENIDSVREWISSLDNKSKFVLINCAGINYNSFSHKANIDDWRKVIDVNLVGTFNVINTILPLMRKNGFGRIINLSSVVAQMGVSGTSAYSASKSGLWGMTKTIAKENAVNGITINNLNLGYFDIGMIDEVPEDIQKDILDRIPCGHLGNPENIYNAVRFLIENDYINGSSIDINGGLF